MRGLPPVVSLFAAGLLATTLLAPGATAHGSHGFQQGKALDAGYVTFGLETKLPVAGASTGIAVSVQPVDGEEQADVDGVRLVLTGPGNATLRPAVEARSEGLFEMNATFPSEGAWRANVTLQPSGESAEFTFPVYAPGPYAWESPNAAASLFAVGHEAVVQVEVREWRTGALAPAAEDATVRLEHWESDHSAMISEEIIPLEAAGPGRYVLRHSFEEEGMYHAFLGSPTLDLAYDDRPYVHLYAWSCEEIAEMDPAHEDCGGAERVTPGPALVVAAVALALTAAARRRGS